MQGLLDFAFGPAFSTNNRFYVSYTVTDNVGEVCFCAFSERSPAPTYLLQNHTWAWRLTLEQNLSGT